MGHLVGRKLESNLGSPFWGCRHRDLAGNLLWYPIIILIACSRVSEEVFGRVTVSLVGREKSRVLKNSMAMSM